MKDKVIYVYYGGHIIHEKFAREVTKDKVRLSDKIPLADIYLVEGEYAKMVLLRMRGKIPKKSKIIPMISDPRLYYLYKNIRFDLKKERINKGNFFRPLIAKFLLNKVDGVFCAGHFQKSLLRKFNKKSPVRIFYPFIEQEVYNKIKKIKPKLGTKNVLFIGNGWDPYVKGIDIMVDSFREARKKVRGLNLYIVGEWKVRKEWTGEGIHFEGRKDILKYLKKCSLGIHIGRGEGFGVDVIEMMHAGIPVIVSEATGAKEFPEKVKKNLVVHLDKKAIAERIVDYFNMKTEDKKRLSVASRYATKGCDEKSRLKEFKKEFDSILNEIK